MFFIGYVVISLDFRYFINVLLPVEARIERT